MNSSILGELVNSLSTARTRFFLDEPFEDARAAEGVSTSQLLTVFFNWTQAYGTHSVNVTQGRTGKFASFSRTRLGSTAGHFLLYVLQYRDVHRDIYFFLNPNPEKKSQGKVPEKCLFLNYQKNSNVSSM